VQYVEGKSKAKHETMKPNRYAHTHTHNDEYKKDITQIGLYVERIIV